MIELGMDTIAKSILNDRLEDKMALPPMKITKKIAMLCGNTGDNITK